MEKPYIAEKIASLAKAILDLYIGFFRKRPLLTIITVLVYAAGLSVFWLYSSPERLSAFRSLFSTQPQLELTIYPTEAYQFGDMSVALKRIDITNRGERLGRVKVSIRAPSEVEEIRFYLAPQVSCQLAKFGPTEHRLLFEVSCPELAKGQRMNLVLSTQKGPEAKGPVVVEIVGSSVSGKFVGTSEAGSMDYYAAK